MDNFCPLPWSSTFIDTKGSQHICCRSSISLPPKTIDFNHEEIRKVRLQILNGDFPESCSYCYKAEKNGGPSLRKDSLENQKNVSFNYVKSRTNKEGFVTIEPFDYSLIVGNKCNLKCAMCIPECSSQWFFEKNPKETYNPFDWTSDNKFVNKIIKYIISGSENNDSIYVWISGGEFTINQSVHYILDELSKYNLENNNNIYLQLLSNGTTLSKKLESLIRKFNVRFNFSIDGIGEKNNYIRYPSKFSVIEKNINKVKDLVDKIFITISSINVFYIDEIIEWCERNNFKTHFEIVYGPAQYLNPTTLPKNVRKYAVYKLQRYIDRKIKFKCTEIKDLERVINSLKNSNNHSHISIFYPALEIDKDRGANLLEIFPDWKRFLK